MIYDSINHIDFYLGSSKNLDKALAVIKMMDFDKLPMGDLVINNKVKIVKKNFSFPVKEKIFGELHSETIDIHLYGGSGEEIIYFESNYNPVHENLLLFNPENDVAYFEKSKYDSSVTLKPGHFAIFFPGELHFCKIKDEKANKNNFVKLLLKVKI
ncbi:YhcH/YjgK/YiaL family protein [Mycoplasmopsis adleri]|uniref:YhcH/YjgK/YiaL family protein n=1 Tax=Mycoplasmopsis adleri TaxID=51362 RepID=UPI003873C374